MDEILKMFNDSDSFYFSLTGDITKSVQRQNASKNGELVSVFKSDSNVFICWVEFAFY